MSTHDRYLRLIGLELDGEIEDGERQDLFDHLKACVACRKVAQDFRKMSSVMREIPVLSPRRSLVAAARHAFELGDTPRVLATHSLVNGNQAVVTLRRMAAAAAILVVAGMWFTLRPPSKVWAAPPDQDLRETVDVLMQQGSEAALEKRMWMYRPDPYLPGRKDSNVNNSSRVERNEVESSETPRVDRER